MKVNRSMITEGIALFFVCLLLYTGINKLLDQNMFIEQLSLNPLMYPIAERVAWMLPVSEFIIAIILFLPRTRKLGLVAALLMMIGFTAYVIYIISYNETLPCSCGGMLDFLSWPQHLVFNSVCIALLILVLRWSGKRKESDCVHQQKLSPSTSM